MVQAKTKAPTAKRETGQNTRRLWLVRHGLTEWNMQQRFCGHSDVPLSARGRVQARWLARRLEKEAISIIYTSDLARARETATIIASQITPALQVEVSAAWREMDFGAWEGLTFSEIAEQFKDQSGFFTDPEHFSPPDGESLAHLLERVQAEMAAIAYSDDMPMEGDAVIVSHGGPLRILLCSILGMPLERQWQLRLDHGSLSAIDLLLTHESTVPRAILASMNVQNSTHPSHSPKNPISTTAIRESSMKAASVRRFPEGTI